MDLMHNSRDQTKATSPEYKEIWEGIIDMPGFDSENPIIARENQDRFETYQHFNKKFVREVTEAERQEPWYKAFISKHDELIKLERLDDGEWVFKDWAKQYKARTFVDIGKEILVSRGEDPDVFFPQGCVFSDIRNWIKEHGEYNEGPYVGCMEYFATGEGMTYRIISSHAESTAHFILYCGAKLGGSYFVQGLDIYKSLEEAKQDKIFKNFVPESAYGMFAKDGHVAINLDYHVNFS